ncbi:MAG TPA: Clp protease N-terminal domain-containing protein [Actinopolymorphaceae bacterium]
MTPPPTLHDLIETVRRDSASDDVLDQLATARALVAELSETGDAVLGYFVDRARVSGKSWTEISNVLGVTKQAVHKRFAGSFFAGQGGPTLQRMTARARSAFDAAAPAAAALGHPYIGTEHLLLGLYAEPESIATKILLEAGISREDVEADVLARTGRGPGAGEDEPPLTPRAAAAMTGSLAEALKLGHNYIGTEHLLLALYRDPEAVAPQILVSRGLTEQTAREKVIEALAGYTRRQDQR